MPAKDVREALDEKMLELLSIDPGLGIDAQAARSLAVLRLAEARAWLTSAAQSHGGAASTEK